MTTTRDKAMGKRFERLKQKYWDGDAHCGDLGGVPVFAYHTPWLKRFWLKHQEHIAKGFWTLVFTVLGALILKGCGLT